MNEGYLLNEKGAVKITNSFDLYPAKYQQWVESVLAVDAESIRDDRCPNSVYCKQRSAHGSSSFA